MPSSDALLADLLSEGILGVTGDARGLALDLSGLRAECCVPRDARGLCAPDGKIRSLACFRGARGKVADGCFSASLDGAEPEAGEPRRGWEPVLNALNSAQPVAGVAFRRCFVEFRQVALRVLAVRVADGVLFVALTDARLRRKAARKLAEVLSAALSRDFGCAAVCLAAPEKTDGSEPFGRDARESLLALIASVSRYAARGCADKGMEHG